MGQAVRHRLREYVLTATDDHLSDLFFNHDHPNYNKAIIQDVGDGDLRKAVEDDAKEFLFCFPPEQHSEGIVQALTDDFFARL